MPSPGQTPAAAAGSGDYEQPTLSGMTTPHKQDHDPNGDGGEHSPLLSADVEAGLVAAEVSGLRHHRQDRRGSSGSSGGSSGDILAGANTGGAYAGDEDEDESQRQRTRSVWYMMLLTLSIGGLQIAWSVELSNGSPFLLSLGLSKSLMALVWIAGPLTGTLVQPYVGMLSDSCRVSWGKRKPFMLGGAAATIVSLMCLAWTREVVGGGLQAVFDADPTSGGVRTAIIVVAVFWVYVLDFAINTVQAAIRAFIVDCAPAHQQEAANSMASRMTGVGNIIGYVAGYANLPTFFWWLGDTQFKDLCAIASVALGSTIVISCLVIHERDPRLDGPPSSSANHRQGVASFFRQIFVSIRRLPPQIKRVCIVQFCAWVGFFPMLFYTSSYIGEIYVEPFLQENPHMTPEQLDRLYEEATRVGTFALLVYSITSLCTNVFLPFFIAPTYDTRPAVGGQQAAFEADIMASPSPKSWLDYLIIPGFTLRRAWMLSLLLFSGSMSCTVLVNSVAAATVLIGLVGITWALTLWAPWAIISAEISRRDVRIRAQKQQQKQQQQNHHQTLSGHYNGDGAVCDGPVDDGLHVGEDYDDNDGGDEEEVDQAGVILGIHNMAIAAPQMIATVGSSIIFKFLQKPRGTPGDHSIAVVMALGGVTVLVAAYFVHRIEDEPADLLSGPGPYTGLPVLGEEDEEAGEEEDISEVRSERVLSRRPSGEQLTRESQDRAALARGSSYGGGLEY